MSKELGQKIGIKFNSPINPLTLAPTTIIDESYTSPSGTVAYSNQNSSTNSASNAFDNSTSSYWETRATLPQWNMIGFAEARQVAGFRLYSGASYRPNAVDLYGSNDGVNFDLIIHTNNDNTTGWKEYTFDITEPYKYYKWEVGSTHTSGRVYVYELQLLFAETANRSGNENAFTITGQEYLWLDGSNNNGVLENKTYEIKTVQTHPTEPNSIQLIMRDEIRNIQGDITIAYNQALGTLAGVGGVVKSFEVSFTPEDLTEGLTRTGVAIGTHENINVSIDGAIDLIYITKQQAYSKECIEVSIGGTIQLIDIGEINP